MLPAQAIREFQALYKKRYGTKLTEREAVFRANNLMALYRVAWESACNRACEDNNEDEYESEETEQNG